MVMHTKIGFFPSLSHSSWRSVMRPPSHQQRATSPNRVKSPTTDDHKLIPAFSEAKLVEAIQTLDATSNNTTPQSSGGVQVSRSASLPLTDSLRKAFCILLEIASCFDSHELVNKHHVVTVSNARVLGCLKRFVTSCASMESPLGACCGRKCEQRLLQLVLLSVLFRMCREPEIAPNVVKEDLHSFLIKMCITSEMKEPGLTTNMNSKEDDTTKTQERAFDPHDLMITIDPFDWCYQPMCTRLLKENTSAFFIPMGIRSLVCLLRGTSLPTDEVSEFEQQIHSRSKTKEKNPKRRKLPSIFAFPRNNENNEHAEESCMRNKGLQCRLTPLCCENLSSQRSQCEIRGLWSMILNENSRTHLALRSAVALALHLPRPSPEHRSLLLEGNFIRRILRTYTSLTHNQKTLPLLNSSGVDVKLSPFQLISTENTTLKRIASSALPLFAVDQKIDAATTLPKHQLRTVGRKTLSPISKNPDFTTDTKKHRDSKQLSIQYRLGAASKAASSEIVQWENEHESHLRGSELDRSHRRLAVRKMCADVECLRIHLVTSLEILCSGRQHPDPQQSFSEWIKSLPTLETLERERLYQQEMRQRQILEQQYQKEAQRRHERDECVLIQANDVNVPEESELTKQQQKHEHFIRMQAEIRQLEQIDSDDDSLPKAKIEPNARKEKLAIQERQRLQRLDEQRCEGRELEKMRREDLYYVERILRDKATAKQEQEKRERSRDLHKNAIEEQQKYIARMRLLDEEKHLAERETSGMRLEDLFGRQMRFREAEKAKEELKNEWHERKTMQTEEQDCRSRWILWERALLQQEQEELKKQRAEARRLKRQQQREEKYIRAAWIESWDENGNMYYYNSRTGLSQWETPT